MSLLPVAGLQFDIAWEDPAENFLRVEPLAQRAAAAGARLLVLPEMFATGFSMDAETIAIHDAATRDFLAGLARRLGVWVGGGYVEAPAADSRRPRNACSLFDPQGNEVLRYRKLHPFSLAGEDRHYEAGDELPTVDVEGVRVTALICYDLRFPEPFRAAAEHTDLFLIVANWPDPRIHAWSTLLAARAIENQAYVLGVNRVGEAPGLHHSGQTALIDPLGRPLATATRQAAAVCGSVDAREVDRLRHDLPFLADRRRKTYRKLEGEALGLSR